MTNRVTIGIEAGVDWNELKRELSALGAESIREPSAELPDVFVVELSPDQDAEEFLQGARELPGVRYAEPDAWRWTY